MSLIFNSMVLPAEREWNDYSKEEDHAKVGT